jgi:large subunit ribosomal protein L4
MLIDLYLKDGTKSGQVELSDDVFAVEPNEHAMHMAVVVYLAHQRQGTAKTKVRHEVRGGGKKPWRQKGRGTARAGSTRSPLWVHGGTIHGPKPRTYDLKMTKKMSRLAKRSALSVRAAENNIIVVEDFKLDEIKTKLMAGVLGDLNLSGEKTLILLPESNPEIYLSTRNIPKVAVREAANVTTYEILNCKKLLLFKSAVESLQNACIN